MEWNKPFQKLSWIVIVILLLLMLAVTVAAGFFSIVTFQMIFYTAAACLMLVFMSLVISFFAICRFISNEGQLTGKNKSTLRMALKIFMPILLAVSNIFSYRKDEIRRVYIQANNAYVLGMGIKAEPEKTLVILPHCLQSSKCRYRIREGLEDCQQCGSCNIGDIKQLIQRYGVHAELATGGTSARKTIKDTKPEFVIAVACERDLSSGTMDVRGLPVYGLLNKRPNGPCRDTFTDIAELERMIQYFTVREVPESNVSIEEHN